MEDKNTWLGRVYKYIVTHPTEFCPNPPFTCDFCKVEGKRITEYKTVRGLDNHLHTKHKLLWM